MSDLLTNALLATLEPQIRRIVDERIAAALSAEQTPAPRPTWATLPKACELAGISVKRGRAIVKQGQVQVRSRNLDPANAKQIKLEVHVGSLEAALAGEVPQKTAPVVDAAGWAAARARKAAP